MKTAVMKSNGVRDSTEERAIRNWAAEYAKNLVDVERRERKNADSSHASERASETSCGHVKLSDRVDSISGTSDATAATPKAVKTAYDKATEGITAAEVVQQRLEKEAEECRKTDRALLQRLAEEAEERESADYDLLQRLAEEADERKSADYDLLQRLLKEVEERRDADDLAGSQISEERDLRIAADNALSERASVLEEKAHVHNNKHLLDCITAERMEKWDRDLEFTEHIQDIIFGFEDELARIYGTMGVTVYDGGLFGMEQTDIALDGGMFDDEVTGAVDCRGFEPYVMSAEVNAVMDGGVY